MPALHASLTAYAMTDRRAIHSNEYVAHLTGAAGCRIATVHAAPNQLPDIRFRTRSAKNHFIDWASRLADCEDTPAAVLLALRALQASAAMTRYRGIAYRLAGDPWPWDDGTVRAFPVGLPRQSAKHLLQVHYRDQTPMIWQPERQAFRLVRTAPEPARMTLPPPPVTDLPDQSRLTQLDLFAPVDAAVGALA